MRAHAVPALPDWSRSPSAPWAVEVARRVLATVGFERSPSRRSGLVSGLRVGLWRAGVPVVHRERAVELVRWAGDAEGAVACPLIAGAWLDAVAPLSADERARCEQVNAWSTPRPLEPRSPGSIDVEVLSGLPGVGKDFWLAANRPGLPVVSLDALRVTLGLADGEGGPMLWDRSLEAAAQLLREGRPFAWSATNLRRRERRALVAWLTSRGATVTLRAIEAPWRVQRARNRSRSARVPEPVIERMLARWEPPWPGEAHHLCFAEDGREVAFD
ncbi:MAG: AAA family ATPase [Myxococcaceae bacterium]|nr:AAA family ATPase [Myxococcaceae bacterium]